MTNGTATVADQKTRLNIPLDVQEQFPELIQKIVKSESMNHEERQYWIDVLPIMTDDQITNLKSILDNEKKEIEKADQRLKEDFEAESKRVIIKFDALKYKEKQQMRMEAEHRFETEEKEHEKNILEEIESMEV